MVVAQADFSATDPFDSHFSVPTEDDLSPKIQAAEKNNWNMAKKEVNGLRLIRSVPKQDGSEATLLPAMKSMANVKVCNIECYFYSSILILE